MMRGEMKSNEREREETLMKAKGGTSERSSVRLAKVWDWPKKEKKNTVAAREALVTHVLFIC